MRSICGGTFEPGASSSALRPHHEAGSSVPGAGPLSVGELFSAQPPSRERTMERFPATYPAKGSLGAAAKFSALASVGVGPSLIIGFCTAFGRLGHRAVLLWSVSCLGFAALWLAGAKLCKADANKALALATEAGCEARSLGWLRAPMDRDGIRSAPRGIYPSCRRDAGAYLCAPHCVILALWGSSAGVQIREGF